MRTTALAVSLALAAGLAGVGGGMAQPRKPDTAAQQAAMKKLDFLVGNWSGDARVIHGAETIRVHQTEEVHYRLNGLLLLIEGTGTNPQTGAEMFHALAVVSYDDAAGAYRFRAYNDGAYLDTEMKVPDHGFEWGFTSGPAAVRFMMRLNEKGEWVETGEVTMSGSPPAKTFEMLVRRQP